VADRRGLIEAGGMLVGIAAVQLVRRVGAGDSCLASSYCAWRARA
jgi:hypothetical protein